MSAPRLKLVSQLQAQPECSSRAPDPESRNMASRLDPQVFEDIHIAYSALVDPNDETIETEITEEMISLALEAVEQEQVWPFCRTEPMVARAPRPTAEVIRFPGC